MSYIKAPVNKDVQAKKRAILKERGNVYIHSDAAEKKCVEAMKETAQFISGAKSKYTKFDDIKSKATGDSVIGQFLRIKK